MALIVAGLNCLGAAIITTIFKDRERAQFVYSIAIVAAAGMSYWVGTSPITIITQLAIGDALFGLANVGLYLLVLALAVGGFFSFSGRLMERAV